MTSESLTFPSIKWKKEIPHFMGFHKDGTVFHAKEGVWGVEQTEVEYVEKVAKEAKDRA